MSTVRVKALLTALAFVLSTLFGLIHEATTQHVVCAEHGELIHGEPAGVGGQRAARPASPLADAALDDGRGDPNAAIRDVRTITSDGHDHCTLISALRASRVVSHPPAVAPAPTAIAKLAITQSRPLVARERALYRMAPKTSPPA